MSVGGVIGSTLSAARARARATAGVRGAAHALAWWGSGTVAVMCVEAWGVALPYAARAGFAAMLTAGAAGIGWVRGIRVAVGPPGEEALALEIERGLPELRQRLVTWVQAPAGTPAALRAALGRETEERLAALNLRRLMPWGSALPALCAVVLALAGLCGAGATRGYFLRAAGVPGVSLPHRTRVEVLTSEDLVVVVGSDVTISARAHGAVPRDGTLALEKSTREMARDASNGAGPDAFSVVLKDVRESFSYRVRLNDDESEQRAVRVVPETTVRDVEIVEAPPAYTHLPARAHALADLTFLEGSKLSLRVKGSAALSPTGGTVTLATGSGKTVVVPIAGHGMDGTADVFPPVDTQSLTVVLEDVNHFRTPNPVARHVEMIPDRPPTLSLVAPRRTEDIVTTHGVIPVVINASDDYGIASLRLRYVAKYRNEKVTASLDLAIPPESISVKGTFPWDIGKLKLQAGTELEWWLEALDTNTVSGPGRAETGHRRLSVLSDEEVRKALLARLDKSIDDLQGTRESQQDLSTQLGKLILEKQ